MRGGYTTMLRHKRNDMAAATCYPFQATRTRVWRNITSIKKDTDPSMVVKLPETTREAFCRLTSVSTQQALCTRYLRNSMAISYAASGIAVFHLGGLPGAGKTSIVKELIAELNDIKLIDSDMGDVLMCSKSNSAKASLMAGCENKERGTLLYPPSCFATLNAGFSIPVVHSKNEITEFTISRATEWLKRKVLDFHLGNVQLLVIDEYTMSSCREIVYIDAILRMIKFRPDVPFGGVFVLFLGDNRQNSAVVEKNDDDKQPVKLDEDGDDDIDDDNDEYFNSDKAKLYTEVFIKIMKTFTSKKYFGDVKLMKKTINNRLEVLLKKEMSVSSTNNDILLAHERRTENEMMKIIAENDFLSDKMIMKIVNGESFEDASLSTNKTQELPFPTRCKNIAQANLAIKDKNATMEPGSAGILKCTPLSVIVEEGLKSEIEHLSRLRSMNNESLEKFATGAFNEIIKSASKAMAEIDYSGREKLYIVSSLSERFKDAHVTSMMDQEILNAKLLYGSDEKCCDVLPFNNVQKRSVAISACIKNAFIREGWDIKDQIPIAKYFKDHLKELGEFLRDENLLYKDMTEKSLHIKSLLKQKLEVKHFPENDYTSRSDIPEEVNVDYSTNERVGALVDFHVTWYKWLANDCPSDIVRTRMWHLYLLVRMQQVGQTTPLCEQIASSGRLFFSLDEWRDTSSQEPPPPESDVYDEYWLRVLSMPITSSEDTQKLPAYSSFLSTIARTYIMSSLKRVNAVKHAYALMYGVSLLDMTVRIKELVDSRQVPSLNLPIGFTKEFSIEEYFESIFPSIINEYFMHRPKDVSSESQLIEKVKDSIKVSYAVKLAHKLNNQSNYKNSIKYTKKSIILAMRMLTSISKGNIRSKLTKKRMNDDEEDEAPPVNKIQKMNNNTSHFILEKMKKQENSAIDRMMGAITLTRRHAQKNAVSNLVDASIINQSEILKAEEMTKEKGINSISATRIETKFFIKNIDVSYLNSQKLILFTHMQKILEAIRQSEGKPLIDAVTDARLLRESQNSRTFTKILTDLKKKVTQVKSVNLYQGQHVVFTNTNVHKIHGTHEKFVTKDTGVVTDIALEEGVLTVSVLVERLGKDPIKLTEGKHFLGVTNRGEPPNAFVQYIPLDSSQSMTIYSCQGQTFSRDTIVDLTNASTQDAYVAITRNNDPLNLYIVQIHESENKNLANIKYCMGKDRTSLLPLGGVGKLGGEEFVNYDAINVSKEVLGSIIVSSEEEDERLFAAFNPTKDTVTAAQRFILNRSGNVFAFNSAWMDNTAKQLKKDGNLDIELNRIKEFFFGKGNTAKEFANYYEDLSHNKLIELFTAVTRSITHYCMSSHYIMTPSLKMMQDHIDKHKNRKDYVKIHPSFLNAPPMKDSLSDLFYDVAPHTKAAMVFQFYAHYLFMVYEQLHICNSSFAFLPSTSPMLNYHTRPDVCEKSFKLPTSCAAYVPGGGLGYESNDYANSIDGGSRDENLRIPITTVDHVADNIDALRKNALSSSDVYDEEKAAKCAEYVAKSMLHNLRRTGKFCRPKEVCGLSKHGAIVTATQSDKIKHSHAHQSEKGWISFASEANMYGLLIFMTKMAAASGVFISIINDCNHLEPSHRVNFSREVLWCGQVPPMNRVQFTFHVRASGGCVKLFSEKFGNEVLRGVKLKMAQVLMMTEMLGHSFARHSTSEIRSSIFHGAGKVVAKCTLKGHDTATILKQLEQFVITKLQQTHYARATFFITCCYE